MPTKRAPRRSNSFKACSRKRRPGCSKKPECSYDGRRSPACQPKRKRTRRKSTRRKSTRRKSTRRKSTRRKSTRLKSTRRKSTRRNSNRASTMGGLMDRTAFDQNMRDRNCALSSFTGTCADDCAWSSKSGRCVDNNGPLAAGRFLNGTKFITFRSKKPSCSFRIPITPDTVFGKYSGAIRFEPRTGKLNLCYGPKISPAGTDNSEDGRPVLSMLLKPKLNEQLWKWYLETGLAQQSKRISENTNLYYAEKYGLPGASYQLTYAEVTFLEEYLIEASGRANQPLVASLEDLSKAPDKCPKILEDMYGTLGPGCISNTFPPIPNAPSNNTYDARFVLNSSAQSVYAVPMQLPVTAKKPLKRFPISATPDAAATAQPPQPPPPQPPPQQAAAAPASSWWPSLGNAQDKQKEAAAGARAEKNFTNDESDSESE